jgi:eukaryotic-like serine/threonine-protein kinase
MTMQPEALDVGGDSAPLEGGECLTPDAAAGLVQGWLEGDELRQAEAHIGACDDCRRYVSELVKASDGDWRSGRWAEATVSEGEVEVAAAFEGAERVLSRGASLGRYVVDGLLGVGGMGVVYAAFDPRLDRKVALKVLRPKGAPGATATERLLREARAMASLSHPNVVPVYDVDVHEGRLFLAMEYVEGVTLRAWLLNEARSTRQMLRALVQAGRGLAAAHAAGLVHRDVKPDNVLVDRRGRVCVTDFGLARRSPLPVLHATPIAADDDEDAPHAAATRSAHHVSLGGTPAYMAPELYLGRPADARSDQFGFCVMLYEALYRQHPFKGSTPEDLIEAVMNGRVREPPARADVPRRVHRALVRGLSVEPAQRFASMGELLDLLTGEAGARRRRALAVAGAVATACALALAYRQARLDARSMCQVAERTAAGAWDESRKGAVREAFLATGRPFAADAWRWVEGALDRYARDWAQAQVEACEATHVRGEQSRELFDLRVACLDDRRRELSSVVGALESADGEVVANAVEVTHALTPVAVCADKKALLARARPPADASAAEVVRLRDALANVMALRGAGKFREALARAAAAVRGAEALGGRFVLAEALYQQGMAQDAAGEATAAKATMQRALAVADAAGDDAVRARAWTALLRYAGPSPAERELVPFFNEQAKAAIERLGGDPSLDGVRRCVFADALAGQRRLDEAFVEYEGALALLERTHGPESRQAQACLNGLAVARQAHGDYDAAEALLRHCVEMRERTFGAHHPGTAPPLNDLGTLLAKRLRLAEAETYHELALRVMREAVGEDSLEVAMYENNLGEVLLEQGQGGRALAHFQRALPVFEAQVGPEHPYLMPPLAGLGRAYLAQGDRRRAVELLERAVRMPRDEELLGELAQAQFALAQALAESGLGAGRVLSLAAAARAQFGAGGAPLDDLHRRLVEQWLARRPGHPNAVGPKSGQIVGRRHQGEPTTPHAPGRPKG